MKEYRQYDFIYIKLKKFTVKYICVYSRKMQTTITLNKEMMKTKFEKVVTHFEREGMFGMGGRLMGISR